MTKRSKRKKKKRKQQRNTYTTKHHLIPKSRGGSNDKKNIKKCSWKKHKAFNILFVEFYLKTSYVILFLQTFDKNQFLEHRHEKNKNEFKNAWGELFGSLSDEQIVSILKYGGQKNLREQRNFNDIKKFRKIWKKIFRINLKPNEIIVLLKRYSIKIFVKNKRTQRASKILGFHNKTKQEIIKIIKNEWSPKGSNEGR